MAVEAAAATAIPARVSLSDGGLPVGGGVESTVRLVGARGALRSEVPAGPGTVLIKRAFAKGSVAALTLPGSCTLPSDPLHIWHLLEPFSFARRSCPGCHRVPRSPSVAELNGLVPRGPVHGGTGGRSLRAG